MEINRHTQTLNLERQTMYWKDIKQWKLTNANKRTDRQYVKWVSYFSSFIAIFNGSVSPSSSTITGAPMLNIT